MPDNDIVALVDQRNVSPKLESSGNPRDLREIPEAYNPFSNLPCCFFKYVIQTEGDLNEAQKLIDRYSISANKVMLMPEAATRETLIEKGGWLSELCKDRGYGFSNRLQVLLWDNMRGV